ncbi:hypothetical protein B0T20DRAFT_128452 [Sordaria brevicollis]|uniref:Uncharacterized protein n=1 Tax=Sordaria brevicollis TaxID=83679 RepID=A0AAE0PLH5_SORBR|nr:hypothetical protein B0T20DRAFT_128452 [Sordaria brevicollis]
MPTLPSLPLAVADDQEQLDLQAPTYPFHVPSSGLGSGSLPVLSMDYLGFELLNIWTWPTLAVVVWFVMGLVVFGVHVGAVRGYLNGGESSEGSKRWRGSGTSTLGNCRALWVFLALGAGMYLFFWPVFLVWGWGLRSFRSARRGDCGRDDGGEYGEEEKEERYMPVVMSPPPSYGVSTMSIRSDMEAYNARQQLGASRTQMTTMSTAPPSYKEATCWRR